MIHDEDVSISFDRITSEWLAGFFDGEGSIMAQSWNGRNATAGFTLTQKDIRILTMIQARFGYVGELGPIKSVNGICHRWRCRGAPAIPFLRAIQPFVICKKRQVDLAICFLEAIAANSRKWQSDQDHEDRLRIADEIHRLNQEGNKSGVQ